MPASINMDKSNFTYVGKSFSSKFSFFKLLLIGTNLLCGHILRHLYLYVHTGGQIEVSKRIYGLGCSLQYIY